MAKISIVSARVEKHIKDEAKVLLLAGERAMGLSVSDANPMMPMPVVRKKALPLELLVPNAAIIEAIKKARRGGLKSFATIEDLMADLEAD